MNLQVHITSFGNDPYFHRGYTEVIDEDIDETLALFPLNEGETQAHVDARVRKFLAVDALLAALEDMVRATDSWNAAVQDIIGRQPHTGIALENARVAIKKAKGEAE